MIGLKAMLLLLLCQVVQQATAASTQNPPSRIVCPMIKCIAECYQGVDSNGCTICNCENTCQVTKCPAGQKCIMRSVTCIRAPCPSQPQCVPDYDATPENPIATTECPLIKCPGECYQGIDSNGCYTCRCENTCRATQCPGGQKCVMVDVACFAAPCYPQPQCVPNDETPVTPTTNRPKGCREPMCGVDCKRIVGPDGCPECDCSNTCAVTLCPEGHTCVMKTVVCKKAPCYKQAECVPNEQPKTCPGRIKCTEPCAADLGPDGCYSKCSCPETCRDKQCNADEVCDFVQVYCFRAPCFPVPTCLPRNRTCSQRPNADRCPGRYRTRWTYNSNTKACETFSYYGCTPSPNTFNNRKECTDLCVQGLSCPPRREMCMKNCYWGQRTAGTCPECICPCQTVRCTANTECRLREGDCSRGEPCRRTAYCAPVREVTCGPVCARACPYGNVKDVNGCDTCECNSAPITPYDEA